jgi:hypothetical protein
MHRSTGRLFVAVFLLAGAGLFAPAVRAQGDEDSAAPPPDEAAPAPARPVPPVPSPPPQSERAVVLPPTPKPPARTGPPIEAGLPGWISAPPALHVSSGLDWHGNLELDNGYVRYSFDVTSKQTLTVYDSRGRFVLGPLLTQDLGNDYFLRVTGQAVAWVREIAISGYQINADDVYVQVGKQGLWDFMAGRFLTWRVFRKGLGFDLYTLEDTGARISDNYGSPEWFPHMYEVNAIFMRDPTITPAGRAAFHFYPTSWSGIEMVGSYGHLDSSQNVLGGRLAAGMKLEYFSLLAGAEYLAVTSDIQKFYSDSTPCDKCNSKKTYGAGGSAAVTPVRQLEIAFSLAYNRVHDWALADALDRPTKTLSWGGYLQLDAGSLLMHRSLFVGGAFFRTEFRDTVAKSEYDSQDQIAASLAYPLGFNNAVVKLVFSEAKGYQQSLTPGNDTTLTAHMYSVRLRFAYYY